MSKYLLLLSIIIMLAPSCSSLDRQSPIHKNIDPELVPFVEEFVSKAPIDHLKIWRNYKLSMGFKNLPGKTVGVCYGWDKGYREISIDPEAWKRYSKIERKSLIFHELIHCLCNRGHDFSKGKYEEKEYFWTPKDSGFFLDNCPTSLMHPTIQDRTCLKEHWDHYLEEMWERCDP